MSADDLVALAQERFRTVTPGSAEERLFRAVASGEWAIYTTGDEEKDKPANADQWGEDRTLLADRIAWLCKNEQAGKLVTNKGIQVEGARIEGILGLDQINIGFWLELVGCALPQGMNLRHASVGAIVLAGSQTGPISADGIKVAGGVFFRNGFRAEGEVRLPDAEIGGVLVCENGQFNNPNGKALNADGIKVTGAVFLRGSFKAEGSVRLLRAEIGKNLDCTNGQFSNGNGCALSADGIKVAATVFLYDGFKAEGEVRLVGADIGGDLACENGQFINPKGKALHADGIKVAGNVFLRKGFKAKGEVRLLGAEIGGNLECTNGQFINPDGAALIGERIKVTGNVYLRNGFKAEGRINFAFADVGQGLACTGIDSVTGMTLDLRSAKVGTYWDDPASWPKSGDLYLDGFVYERLDDQAPRDVKSRIKWLRRQPIDKFLPQPYEQLAAVFKKEGREEDAKKILIAKEEDPARLRGMNIFEKIWHSAKKFILCYVYRPWYAFFSALVLVCVGSIFFGLGMKHGLVVPTTESAYIIQPDSGERKLADTYPRFNSFIYSLDVFLSIIDLNQEKYWLPHPGRGELPAWWPSWLRWNWLRPGSLLRIWVSIEILLGWILTSLFIAGLTRVVRS